MLVKVILFLAREAKNRFYIYMMCLRQAYEKTLQTTSRFISQYSQYSQVERKKHQMAQYFAQGGNEAKRRDENY